MKRKLLFALALLISGVCNLWAQTDVTSTYMTNPSFEAANATTGDISATGVFTNDWNITSISYARVAVFNSSSTISTFGGTSSVSNGNYYLMIRSNLDQAKTQNIRQNSDMALPKGKYSIYFDYKAARVKNVARKFTISAINSDGSTTYGSKAIDIPQKSANNAYFSGIEWSTASFEFTHENTTNTRINISCETQGTANNANSQHTVVLLDNFVVKYSNINGSTLAALIAQATAINAKLGTLTSEIATAQGVYDGINDTPAYQETIDNAISTLQTAITTKVAAYEFNPAGDDISALYIWNNGFDIDTNFSSSSSTNTTAATVYPTFGWAPTVPTNCTGATIGYGYSGNINGSGNVTAPTENADGTTAGGALAICVGWNGQVTYKSLAKTFPAGSYRITYRAYNGNTKNTTAVEAIPLAGFTPTSGDPQINSATETFANQAWSTHTYDFELASETEGQIQIGLKPTENTYSYNAPELFIDEVKLTYFDPLKLAQIQWQEVWNNLNALDETALPDAAETAITDALAETEPTTVEGCNTAKAALQALIDSYDDIKAAYDKLSALITLATNEKDNSTGTKAGIESAISTATTNIETRTTAGDLTSDYNTLESARQTYVTGGAQPTAGHVFDYTFKIPDAAITAANEWTSQRLNYNQQYTGAPDNTYFDNNNENRNIQKNIGTLRLGKYELKCATRAHADVTVGNIYVSQNAANLNQTNIHHDGNTGGDLGNGWSWTIVPFDNYKDDKDITLGFYSECGSSKWAGADDFHLYYKGNTVDNETAEALKETVVSGKMNATVDATQSSALSDFESAQTFENYNTLKDAIAAASNSKAVYETLNTTITNAEGWTTNATSVTDPMRLKYNNGSYSDKTTANDIYAEYQAAEITALVAASASNWTSAIINASFETGDMAGWTAESRNDTGVKDQSNGTYSITSGDAVDGSKLFNSWGGTAENNVYQTIKNLPAGTYTLVAVLAGFPGESLVIAANEETGTTVVAGDKTVGYLTSVTFTLDATADVVIKASNTKSQTGSDASFIKADNFQLYVGSSVPASASKPNLLYAINNATNARKSANEGADVFQIPVDAGTTLAGAISDAQDVYDNASATLEQINQAVTDVDEARTTYEATELNAPVEGDAFNLYLVDGLEKTVTFKAGNETSGGYAIGYTDDAGSFYNQAIHFKSTGTKNQYKLYIIDDAGTKHYLCTGTVYGGNNYQIRMTDDEENALAVEVIVTTSDGVYNLKNTVADALIGSNGDTGVYTAQKYKNFNINPAAKCVVPVSCKAGKYGTVIFPFTPDVRTGFDGITFYGAEGVNGDTQKVQLTKVAEPVANVPYLIKNDNGENFSKDVTGWGTATADSYTVGLLTGVYTEATVPVNSYVLQTQNDVQAFYKVTSDFTATPYKCYLTYDASNPVKALFLGFGDADAIRSINNESSMFNVESSKVYNLAGQRLQKLQKGINIVNGKKVLVK